MRWLILVFALVGCASEVAVGVNEEELLWPCNPANEYTKWLRDFAKVPREWCSVGPYFLPDEEQVQAAFCAWHGNDTLYRALGIRRQGLALRGSVSYDTFACQFQRCDIYLGIVTCTCNGCQEPRAGTQQYWP